MGVMPRTVTKTRPFIPGTTGWSASDLDDPEIEQEWWRGRYEIIEGVLTTVPPAFFTGQAALTNLIFLTRHYLKLTELPSSFAQGIDIVLEEMRVVRADGVYLSPEDKRRQVQAARQAGRNQPDRTRILVPPTLIIESISPGHEQHDEGTKRKWYAEFAVPNYWLLNAFERSLRCLALRGREYEVVASGQNDEIVHPPLFPGLAVPLSEVWEEMEV